MADRYIYPIDSQSGIPCPTGRPEAGGVHDLAPRVWSRDPLEWRVTVFYCRRCLVTVDQTGLVFTNPREVQR